MGRCSFFYIPLRFLYANSENIKTSPTQVFNKSMIFFFRLKSYNLIAEFWLQHRYSKSYCPEKINSINTGLIAGRSRKKKTC